MQSIKGPDQLQDKLRDACQNKIANISSLLGKGKEGGKNEMSWKA